MKLIGDIGATFSRLAIINQKNQILYEEKFRNRNFSSFTTLLQQFLQEKNGKKEKIQKACFGVAGPVVNQKVHMTNLQWTLDAKKLQKTLAVPYVVILNDMVLHARGIDALSKKDFFIICKQKNKKIEGNKLYIFPGTGLGVALGIWNGRKTIYTTSEAGHSDFAPRNALEKELYDFLQNKYHRVSYERILSGPGILDVYQFFLRKTSKTKKLIIPSPEQIVKLALSKKDLLSQKTIDLFVSVYGSFVGNVALTIFPTGAIFLGGSLTIAIRKKLQEKIFLDSFSSKGRFFSFLKTTPIAVVLQEKTSLLGAISEVG